MKREKKISIKAYVAYRLINVLVTANAHSHLPSSISHNVLDVFSLFLNWVIVIAMYEATN